MLLDIFTRQMMNEEVAMLNDIQMDSNSDLYVDENDIKATDSIAQAIKIHLRWFWNEWRYGKDMGVPYFEYVLVKNPNRELVISILTAELMKVDGVQSVDDMKVELNTKERKAQITYKVTATRTLKYTDEQIAIIPAEENNIIEATSQEISDLVELLFG